MKMSYKKKEQLHNNLRIIKKKSEIATIQLHNSTINKIHIELYYFMPFFFHFTI